MNTMYRFLRVEAATVSIAALALIWANGIYAVESIGSVPPPLSAPPNVLPMPLSAALDAPVRTAPLDDRPAAGKCQVSISKSQFDFGHFTRGSLAGEDVGDTKLVVGRQLSQVNVVCSEPQRVVLFFQALAGSDGMSYRFGDEGGVRLTLANAQADGRSVQLGQGDSGSPPTTWADRAALVPNQEVMLQDDRPISHLSMQLEAFATVPTNAKAPASVQRWSDSGQLHLQTH